MNLLRLYRDLREQHHRRKFEKIKNTPRADYYEPGIPSNGLVINDIVQEIGDNADEKTFTVYRFYREQNKIDYDDIQVYNKLVLAALILTNDDAFEKFHNIPTDKALSLENLSVGGAFYPESPLSVLFDCFELIGNPKQSIPSWDAFQHWEEGELSDLHRFYLNIPREFRNSPWKLSNQFRKVTYYNKQIVGVDTSSRVYLTVMYILKMLYSEDLIIEVLERCKEEDFELNFFDLPKFLKNWQQLEDYPLEWRLAIISD